MKIYYAPTFLDESRTYPNRKGESRPTGKLRGVVMARRFYLKNNKRRSERMVIPFSWKEDTDESKAEALAKVVKDMEEMPELDVNPSLDFWPSDKYQLPEPSPNPNNS